jgi:hypothetical protein
MIHISNLHFVLGLQYDYKALGSGAQTNPPGPGPAGEVLAWYLMLTGLLFRFFQVFLFQPPPLNPAESSP